MPATYPHSKITIECRKKYINKWDIMECMITSFQLYYGKIKKEDAGKGKFVTVPAIAMKDLQ